MPQLTRPAISHSCPATSRDSALQRKQWIQNRNNLISICSLVLSVESNLDLPVVRAVVGCLPKNACIQKVEILEEEGATGAVGSFGARYAIHDRAAGIPLVNRNVKLFLSINVYCNAQPSLNRSFDLPFFKIQHHPHTTCPVVLLRIPSRFGLVKFEVEVGLVWLSLVWCD